MSIKSLIALGSNLGNCLKNITWAIKQLDETPNIVVTSYSSLIWNKPENELIQPDYLNGVVLIRTTLEPNQLLQRCLSIEIKAGRDRSSGEKGGSRVLDIDLIWMDGIKCCTNNLTLPHPRALNRDFVIIPSIQIFPQIKELI